MRVTRREVLRRAAAAGTAAAGAAALGGCNRKSSVRSKPVEVDFYAPVTAEFRVLYRALVDAFHASHPDIRVRINEGQGDMYDAKLFTLVAGKVAPDVFHVTQNSFPVFASRGICEPLDGAIARDRAFHLADYYPEIVEAMRVDGKLLGLPSDFSSIVMLYNKDLFDEQNIPYPKQGWTQDDYLGISRQLTRDTPRGRAWGTANPPAYNRWPAWVWAWGGDVYNRDLTRCVLDSPAAIAGFSWYANLSLKEGVAPKPNMLAADYHVQLFAAGRLGMMADSRYQYKRFLQVRKLTVPWDVAPMPAGPGGQWTTFIWGGNCVCSRSEKKDEAWELVKFISGPEGAAVNMRVGNALPPLIAAAEAEVARPQIAGTPQGDRYYLDAVKYSKVVASPAQYPEHNDALVALHESLIGIREPAEACREFARRMNEVFADGVT